MLSNRSRLHLFIGLVGLFLGLGACESDEIAEIQVDARVRREHAVVWAGTPPTLPKLSDALWHNFHDGDMVTTDQNGEAWVDVQGCQTIYLFWQSELVKSACPNSGSGTCAISGTSAYNNKCSSEVVLGTMSSDIVLLGSWVSITVLPDVFDIRDAQLTLIVLLEGEAKVVPVIETDLRTLGEPILLGEGEFIYTAPDAALDQLGAIGGVPARTAQRVENLDPLVQALGIQAWIDRAFERAEEDGVPPPPPPSPSGVGPEIVLQGGGGSLEDPRVQLAVLRAIPWADLSNELYPTEDVPIRWELGEEFLDARTEEFNPSEARMLMAEAGLVEGLSVLFFVSLDNGELIFIIQEMEKYLGDVGVFLEVIETPEADVELRIQEAQLEGNSFLWLTLR